MQVMSMIDAERSSNVTVVHEVSYYPHRLIVLSSMLCDCILFNKNNSNLFLTLVIHSLAHNNFNA